MTKKYVLAGAIGAFLAAANIAHAPVLDIHKSPPIDIREIRNSNLVRAVMPKDLRRIVEEEEKAMEDAIREIQLCERDEIYRHIYRAYKKIDVPGYITKKFVRAQIWAESNDYANAIGKDGEGGLTQILPSTWKKIEPRLSFQKYAFNPQYNIPAGIKHLISVDKQLEKRNKNWEKLSDEEKIKLIAATYNCGIGGIIKAKYNLKRVPESTKTYVRYIERLMSKKYKEY